MPRHPAPYSAEVLGTISKLVYRHWRVLDPFAGIGRIHQLECRTVGVEIEPEWAGQHSGTIVGNALHLPFGNNVFDAVATSPAFGNRMADHHNAKDGSHRRTYKHYLGRNLHTANSGKMQWGPEYRAFHIMAWREVMRVLRPGGWFFLNVSDHYRKGKIVHVAEWHLDVGLMIGFTLADSLPITTRRYRFGANADKRVAAEFLHVFRKEENSAVRFREFE